MRLTITTSIKSRSGDLSASFLDKLEATSDDMQALGKEALSRMKSRTARGVDATGDSFEPYSTKGPYYYDPYPQHKGTRAQHATAVETWRSRHPKAGGKGELSRGGHSIRYESYAAFKEAISGDTTVDLRGAAAPHMLDQMSVWSEEPDEVRAGFQSKTTEAAKRALGHIRGIVSRHLPVRRFVGLTSDDRQALVDLRREQIEEKLKS
jgi:hypothetical protein